MKTPFSTGHTRLLAAAAIGLAVWALRVALIKDLGTGIPFWDQWDREGLTIYEPWIQGKLTWRAIFEPHLEHRIVWTHLWNLGLFELCGQWDPMVQMVAQAGIPAVTAGTAVWGLLAVRAAWVWRWVVLAGTLIAFGSPFSYANILWGFQSSFAFLVALSLGGCAAAALAWGHGRWVWPALLAGLAAPFAMGAGALAGPVIIVLAALVALTERKLSRRSRLMLAVGSLCWLWGNYFRSDATVMLFARAGSLPRFGQIWLAALAWPNCRIPGLAVLACGPVLLFTIQVMRKGSLPQPHELFIVGTAIWGIGCAAGGAWTRGGVEALPPSRYYDFLAPLCWVNLLALTLMAGAWGQASAGRMRIAGAVGALAWIGATLYGGAGLMEDFFLNQQPACRATAGAQFEAVNRVLGGAPVDVMISAGLQNQPSVVAKVMSSPTLAPFLPPELQAPPENITPEGTLAVGLAGPHGVWKWRSGRFEVRKSGMVVFVRGDAKELQLALMNPSGISEGFFLPSGRHLGEWSEWLVRSNPGQHLFGVDVGPSSEGLAIIFPRPVSAMGYWVRNGVPDYEMLCGLAGVCLAAALLVLGRAGNGAAPEQPHPVRSSGSSP